MATSTPSPASGGDKYANLHRTHGAERPSTRELLAGVRSRGVGDVARAAGEQLRFRAGRRAGQARDWLAARALSTTAPGTFFFDGETYPYFRHHHNATWRNERAVEVPIVTRALAQARGGAVLEVGNVLRHYGWSDHPVVDKFEPGPGVINEDVLDYDPGRALDLIVTISTLEHVGWDDRPRDPAKLDAVVAHLRSLLAPGGRLVATLPLGYNPHIDERAAHGALGFDRLAFLERVDRRRWREASAADVAGARYGDPHRGANGLLVAFAGPPVS
jgi:SAM-dependent methyltransferase